MRYLVTVAVLAMPMVVQAKDCQKHPIYCQILENHPRINQEFAFELSNVIYKESKKHGIPSDLFTAILMQESTYKLDAKNCMTGIREKRSISSDEVKVCADYGIAQIHYKTIRSYGFDKNRLLTDLEYSVAAGAEVLGWFKDTYSEAEPLRWYCRYNTGTAPAHRIKRNCTKYIHLVERWR